VTREMVEKRNVSLAMIEKAQARIVAGRQSLVVRETEMAKRLGAND